MYAPDRLADRNFKAMSVAERGLLHTMELECWVNGGVPGDLSELGRVLGIEKAEVEAALTDRVMRYFERVETPTRMIVSPELLAYRAKLDERHAKMAAGGKQTQENRKKPNLLVKEPASPPDSHPIREADSPLSREERQGPEKSVYRDEHDEFRKQISGPAPFERAARRGNGAVAHEGADSSLAQAA
jgi:hypothetical protein